MLLIRVLSFWGKTVRVIVNKSCNLMATNQHRFLECGMLQTKWMHAIKIIKVLLNYAGGAYIYIRREYASRIRIIQRSWKTANKQAEDELEEAIASVGATGP